MRDLLDSLHGQGFRRFLLLNGHGGNEPVAGLAHEWMAANPGGQVRFHSWWNGPRTWAVVQRIDPQATHASWLENFPWTRLPGVEVPAQGKPMVDPVHLRILDPAGVRDAARGRLLRRALPALGRGDAGGLGRRRRRGA